MPRRRYTGTAVIKNTLYAKCPAGGTLLKNPKTMLLLNIFAASIFYYLEHLFWTLQIKFQSLTKLILLTFLTKYKTYNTLYATCTAGGTPIKSPYNHVPVEYFCFWIFLLLIFFILSSTDKILTFGYLDLLKILTKYEASKHRTYFQHCDDCVHDIWKPLGKRILGVPKIVEKIIIVVPTTSSSHEKQLKNVPRRRGIGTWVM